MLRVATITLVAGSSALNIGAPVHSPRSVGSAPRSATARMEVVDRMEQSEPAQFVPPEVGTGFAGIQGAIELLTAEHPVLKEMLAKAPEDAATSISRAEFWTNETATMLEVANVIGRWQSHADIVERSEFTASSYREENLMQAGTEKRYQMAKRMGCTERYGLMCNAPKRPFVDDKLAASLGLTCEDFNALPVSMAACNIVYDALAESRSGLIPYKTADERRLSWINEDGSLDESRFKFGLYKSRLVVIFAWFWFGKGNFVWILVIARALADVRPDLFAALNPATEEGKVLWKAFAIL